ncbi:hypothetical protein JCM9157_3476 [Halalkalibacter akibai JCM 9157]|uniref:Uncharacterized protein n=1 Tax=Halalkalibacter akibai (strain ATCC 43226 / DSM 21942 / CIP 109018 / JCM 9157 / 1139) TaxID=1236973 RepID=W4QW01_HALA3|nr:hypothetical protein JCM9157_3476 [Halalkalibacter akibai JCM 9157]
MPQPFTLVDDQKDHPRLEEKHNKNYQRTLLLGKAAIDKLRKENKEITYKSIAEETKNLDSEKKGIHSNSVKRNADLYNYYKSHSNTYARKKALEERKKSYKIKSKPKGFEHIKPDRNKADVRKKLNRLTKKELIEHIIEAEDI